MWTPKIFSQFIQLFNCFKKREKGKSQPDQTFINVINVDNNKVNININNINNTNIMDSVSSAVKLSTLINGMNILRSWDFNQLVNHNKGCSITEGFHSLQFLISTTSIYTQIRTHEYAY